jgi:BASS family bile acid:Na+ symporter
MTAVKVIILLLQASIFLLVLRLGLSATFEDAASLVRRPGLMLRSLIAMNIIMPVFAVLVALIFALHPAVEAALVLLAVSPVPPLLPRLQLKLGASSSYVMGLLVTTSLLAVIVIPLTIAAAGMVFHRQLGIAPAQVAKVVITTILLPLALGMLVHARAPGFAQRIGPALGRVATAILVLAVIGLVVGEWGPMMGLIGQGTLWSITVFVLTGVAVGHWLGGPNPPDRTALGLATASRHPGLAIAIAAANFPRQIGLIAAAILLYMLVRVVVLLPYMAWSKRRIAKLKRPSAADEEKAA